MAAILKLLAVCVFLSCFISQGYTQCELSNIQIKQNGTYEIHDISVYSVSIYNDCSCSQHDVYFDMTGFRSTGGLNPDILTEDGLVNKGRLLPKDEESALKFEYAWHNMFMFKPVKSEVTCSKDRKLVL
ncbi:hypothetical protein LUZ60_000371 [Juncus effusus]|nr:hypothetical protein LUZ60_000371 [Juncus effusus]